MIKAEVVLASSSPHAKPLYTLKLRYPWFIHGELMTHRVLSRNASSNRAIPLKKMLEEVRSDELRAEPVYWGAEQKGMEPGEPLTQSELAAARYEWCNAANAAADFAELMAQRRVHKSLCNRLLMPFTHANVVVSATEWDNFYGLRLDKAADPTMRALAEAMWVAMNEAQVQSLKPGQWHLPFVDAKASNEHRYDPQGKDECQTCIKVSVARCARVSYESHETGKRSTVEEDLKLYDRLVGAQPLHASPAEHQATPDIYHPDERNGGHEPTSDWPGGWDHPKDHGNFVGWRQYRKMLPGEAVAPLPEGYRR
jgi:thymidylate synthase ThyX